MYRKVENGYLLAKLLKMKKEYFYEDFVTASELHAFIESVCLKALELGLILDCIYDEEFYHCFDLRVDVYTLKDHIDLGTVLSGYTQLQSLDIIKALNQLDFLSVLIDIEKKEVIKQERALEKKKLLLKRLELKSLENKNVIKK